MVSLSIRGLVKRFGDLVALDHVDLEIGGGELFFLLGPSGCGKTTLLRALAGFHFPDEGGIFFDGDDITRVPPHKRETGMMFQSYALWPHLNVFRNVAFGLEERRVAKSEIKNRVEEALAMVRLEAALTRRKIPERMHSSILCAVKECAAGLCACCPIRKRKTRINVRMSLFTVRVPCPVHPP
jgi:ABC-type Fe3+/spermidine/putrescine transport system ATPase subunit